MQDYKLFEANNNPDVYIYINSPLCCRSIDYVNYIAAKTIASKKVCLSYSYAMIEY